MKNIISIFFLTIVLAACNTENSSQTSFALLPDATGGADEVMVFLNDAYFSDTLAKSIKTSMTEPYKLLPQSEARFSYSTAPFGKMNTILKRFINPIFVITKSENSALVGAMDALLSDADKKKIAEQKDAIFFRENLWAQNQSIVILVSPSEDEIVTTLEKYKAEIEKYYDNKNIPFYSKLAYINGVNKSLNKQFKEYYGIDFQVPSGFVLAENDKNLVLLRKDEDKSTLFMAFDVMEYNAEIPLNNLGVEKFNSVGKYLDGEKEGSFVVADTTLGFTLETIKENGLVKYENGGLWVMQNDLVGGGPFINQYIIDNANKRVIYLSGMIYGPAEKHKKKYMRQFEAIFNTLKVETIAQ